MSSLPFSRGKKARYGDDPKRDELKTKAQVVAFVKKCVQDGADVIKAKGDAGMAAAVNRWPEWRASTAAYGLIEHSRNTTATGGVLPC
jgi:hypothetical protein